MLGNVVVYALCDEGTNSWQHLVQTRIRGQDLESGGSYCWISTHACLQDHLEEMKRVFTLVIIIVALREPVAIKSLVF